MSKTISRKNIRLALALSCASSFFPLISANAATDTWLGVSSVNWSDAANWSPGLPASKDSLLFTGTQNTTNNNDTSSALIGNLSFDAAAGSFTIGGNTLTLAGDITNSSPNLQSLNLGITLGGLSSTSNVGFHNITSPGFVLFYNTTGGLLRNTGAAVNFSGTVHTTTVVNDATGIIGAFATFGGDWAAVNAGAIIAYTGYTAITAAPAIASSAGTNYKWSGSTANATLALASGVTDINSLNFTDITGRSVTMTATQTLRVGADGGIFRSDASTSTALTIGSGTVGAGTLTAGGAPDTAGELVLNANGPVVANNGIVVNAVIADNGLGKVTVVKTGADVAQLGPANTYTGDTYIDQGRLRAQNIGGYGTGNVYVADGTQAYYAAAGTSSNNFFLSGKGLNEGFFGGAIRLATNGVILNGTVTLTGDATITARGATTTGATINGKITGGFNIEFNGAAAAMILNITNQTNDWTGNTTISFGTLKLTTNSDVIPNGSGKGNVVINGDASGSAMFDLNGKNETMNALLSAGTVTNAFVQNSLAASTSTLTVGDNNASGNFAGIIRNNPGTGGNVALTKIGSGVETLSGANLYTGITQVTAGKLIVNGSLAATAVSVAASATLGGNGTIAGPVTVDGILSPGNSPGTLNLGSPLTLDPGSSMDFDLGPLATNGAGGDTDLINFTTLANNLVGAGNLTLNLIPGPSIDYTKTYTVFQNVANPGFTLAAITGYDSGNFTASFTQLANNYVITFSPAAP